MTCLCVFNTYSAFFSVIGLVSIHSAASYQQDASAKNKDCTDYVEDCGTDAAGGGKGCASQVNNGVVLISGCQSDLSYTFCFYMS